MSASKFPKVTPVRFSLFSERIVEVVVGPSETIWRLHENLLSATSDFFKAAFNSGFKESLEDRILLPEDDPHAFELFVRWLYVRALQGPMGVPEMNAERQLFGSSSSNPSTSYTGNTSTGVYAPATATSATAINIQDCLRLYVLATKLLVEDLENVCVDAAARYYKVGTRRPEIRDVQYIYENTPSGSGMRRLLKERLTLVLFRGRRSNSKDKPVTPEWKEVIDETPELGYDLLSEVSSYNWVPGPNIPPLQRMSGEGCVFHRHEKTELCRPR